MTLLVFNYIVALFFFVYSYYLDASNESEKSGNIVTNMAVIVAVGVLLTGLSVHVCYYDNFLLGAVFFRLCLCCFVYISVLLLKESLLTPYYGKNGALNGLGVVLCLIGCAAAFLSVEAMEFADADTGASVRAAVKLVSPELVPGTGITRFAAFGGVYFILLPALSMLLLFFRGLALRSRIFRQRLVLMSLSMLLGLGISAALGWLSVRYGWAFPFVPLGFVVILLLFNRIREVTTIVDASVFVVNALSFLCVWLLFSVLAAAATGILYRLLPHGILLFFLFAAVFLLLVYFRESAGLFFSRLFRTGSDYEKEMERELDSIEFTGEREGILEKLHGILTRYVECSSLDVLMTDDKGDLRSVYSSSGKDVSFSPEGNKALNFLLAENESVVLRTQAVSRHLFADIKPELLALFDLTGADALIILREGPRIVGIMMLGPKIRAADYSDYDVRAFGHLYSNFFLMMYYLKNIANEGVMLTVARELEFSGQVIEGIQENVDRIINPKADCSFVTKSARKLGGDFIDFIRLDGDRWLFVLGDVSGKGLTASMSMVIMKSVLRTFLKETSDFKDLVVKMNGFVRNNLPKGTFFAGIFGILDFRQNRLYYINCGVPVMFLYTPRYNNAIEIQGEGHVLGFVRDVAPYLRVRKTDLNPQDVLLITTDGLVNSINLRGEQYGKSRVQKQLLDNRTYSADRIVRFLCEDVESFVSAEVEDDITVMVLKYLGSQESK